MPNSVAISSTPPSRSWTSAACTMASISKPRVSTRTCRFFPLIFLPPSKPGGSIRCPLFSALDALAVDDGRGRAGLPVRLLTAEYVKRMVESVERAVVLPAAEVVVHRAARGQVLRDRAPLAAGAQHIHQPVHHLAL